MTTSSSKAKPRERGPLFWIFITLLILAVLCIASLVIAWFTGDYVVEFLRNIMVR